MSRAAKAALLLVLEAAWGCGEEGGSGTGAGGEAGGGAAGAPPVEAGAILPCAPGELEDDRGGCVAPGVPDDGCGQGFAPTGDGACEAELPAQPCAPGTLALPGESSCRPVADCGNGTWGSIPVDATTVHVDASFTGGNSDGTAAQPWTNLQQAIDNAPSGALIAVAEGTYAGPITVAKPVRLWGRCPERVVVDAAGSAVLAVTASGAEVRGLAVRGAGVGLLVAGASAVELERVWAHDTTGPGVSVEGTGAAASLRGSLIEGTRYAGVRLYDGQLAIEDTVVRDIQPGAGDWGVGIDAVDYLDEASGSLRVRHSLIERTRACGIAVQGPMELTMEDSLIRDIEAELGTGERGQGLWGYWTSADSAGMRPTMTVRGSVIERATFIGLHSNGPDVVLERSVVRATRRAPDLRGGLGLSLYTIETVPGFRFGGRIRQSVVERVYANGLELYGVDVELEASIVRDVSARYDGMSGLGIVAMDSENSGEPTQLTMRGVRVERATQGGVLVAGSSGDLESVAVLDTQPRALDDSLGVGLSILLALDSMALADARIRRTVVDGSYGGGIAVAGADVTMTDVLVQNVKPQLSDDDFGDGLGASASLVWIPGLFPTSLAVERATVQGAPRAGMSVFAAEMSVRDSLLFCNGIDLDGESLEGQPFDLEDGGGNVCGCGDERWVCRVLTSNLKPPFSP